MASIYSRVTDDNSLDKIP